MIRDTSGSQKSVDQESDIIYDYLLDCASNESCQLVIREFKNLFIQGKNKEVKVTKALNKIIVSPLGQQQFNQIFTHCFYIVLNCWVVKPESLACVSELFNLIEISNKSSSYDRFRKQLIKLISDYKQSSEYLKLRATIAIINVGENHHSNNAVLIKSGGSDEIAQGEEHNKETINSYLNRYTFLYEYLAPPNPEFEQLDQFIKSRQASLSQDFEIKLSRHILYRYRLKQVAKMKLLSKGAGKVITKVNSPSLLSERAFRVALKQYISKVYHQQTILERSQKFIAGNQVRNSYYVFKQDLYSFLTEDIKPRNSSYQFEQKLKNKINTIFAQSDQKPINSPLILQTCRQLFSFLIADINLANNPQKFANLVANLGTAQAVKILIKIVLICPESKADLEKKIFVIVNHYQLHKIQDAPWVIKTLEHLLIAFSIYFGKIDISLAKSAIDQ